MKVMAAIQGIGSAGEVLWRIGLGNGRIVGLELHVWRDPPSLQVFEMTDEQINPEERE